MVPSQGLKGESHKTQSPVSGTLQTLSQQQTRACPREPLASCPSLCAGHCPSSTPASDPVCLQSWSEFAAGLAWLCSW